MLISTRANIKTCFLQPFLLSGLLLSLLACNSLEQNSGSLFQRQSPQAVTFGEYKVQKGDSLYSIAWRFKRDYKELGRLNDLNAPYLITPGQVLLLGNDIGEIPSKMGYTGKTILVNAPLKKSPRVLSKVSRYKSKKNKRALLFNNLRRKI